MKAARPSGRTSRHSTAGGKNGKARRSTRRVHPPVDLDTLAKREVLTVREAAQFLRYSKVSLDRMRWQGGGPPFVRIGRRSVRYLKADLLAWARDNTANNTVRVT